MPSRMPPEVLERRRPGRRVGCRLWSLGALRRWVDVAMGAAWLAAAVAGVQPVTAAPGARPNILWIVSEDNGCHLGCYGDPAASTPNLDALAAEGMRYRRVWSTAPVCAPARTAIITGMYPSALGAEHMRSLVPLPPGVRLFPQWLRESGYYCSNNAKEDYNVLKPEGVWDASSRQAHWRNRPKGAPFFAVFNIELTHESQVRKRPHEAVLDPARVRVPAYHPDRPEVRRDWAQYHDQMRAMDQRAGVLLAELAAAGLAEDTIVFYYGDNGVGLPRSKRCLHDTGLHVPLIVRVPERWRGLAGAEYRPGGHSDRLIGFVDLAPTVLSLAGVPSPDYFQGTAFLGPETGVAPAVSCGLRGRMDERVDFARSLTDGRFVYIRNYHPHRPWGQHVQYLFETPTTRVWKEMFDAGTLGPEQSLFWRPRAPEELYDLESDPDEVRNLAEDPAQRTRLERFRLAHREHVLRVGDLGFLPEPEMHRRAQGLAPGALARDPSRYPLESLLAMAELAASPDMAAMGKLKEGLGATDSAIRYWATMGLLIRGREAVLAAGAELRRRLQDSSPSVVIAAAEALARHGEPADRRPALDALMPLCDARQSGYYVAVAALNALDAIAPSTEERAGLAALPRTDPGVSDRMASDIGKLVDAITGDK